MVIDWNTKRDGSYRFIFYNIQTNIWYIKRFWIGQEPRVVKVFMTPFRKARVIQKVIGLQALR